MKDLRGTPPTQIHSSRKKPLETMDMWIPRKVQDFPRKFQVKDSNAVLSSILFTFLFLIPKLSIFHGKLCSTRGT